MFRKRAVGTGSANDYSQIFALIDAVSPADNPNAPTVDPVAFGAVADIEQWMRVLAIQRAVGNWDSYGWERGKNDYFFKPTAGLFQHMPWDIDYSLGLGRPADEPLFASNDPRVLAMFNTPAIVRAYWRSLKELAAGILTSENLEPFIDARVNALMTNGVTIDMDAVAIIKNYIWERQGYLSYQLNSVDVPLAITSGASVTSSSNMTVITGTAPVNIRSIILNGVVYPVTWTTATNFSLRVVLYPGLNQYVIQGQDRFGVLIPNLFVTVDATYTGPPANPAGNIVINELMYNPAQAGAQYIEIVNRSQMNFELSYWRIDAVNYQFPLGSILTGGQTIVLAQNRSSFLQSYGNIPLFDLFTGSLASNGEPVALIQPLPQSVVIVDGVRYETVPPWPAPVAGASLQLIDIAQDNSRVVNWAYGVPTPGVANSVATSLPAFGPIWLNEIQTETLVGPADGAGDRDPWVELFNNSGSPASLNGYFLADNYSSNLTQWAFPAGATLAPGEYKLVWADGEPNESTASEWHTSFRLDYGGTVALVRMQSGQPQIVDYLTYPVPGANVSYGDFPDAQAVFRSRLFHPTAASTNLGNTIPVFINEWLARNTNGLRDPADSQLDDWIELYNGGTQPIDLGSYYMTDDAGTPRKYRIPNNGQYVIQPRGFMLVWADNTPAQNAANRDLHVSFRLGGNSGYIGLFAPDGQTLIDQITYGLQTNDVSQGRYADGASQIYFMARPTPDSVNTIPGVNTPPQFAVIPTQFAVPGQRLLVTIRAADPDQLSLTYTLLSGPSTVEVNPSNGLLRWIIPTNQPPGDYLITIKATDNSARSDVTSFTISVRSAVTVTTVAPAPVIQTIMAPGGQATFTIATTPGHTYRILYKNELESPAAWTQLDQDFVAGGPYVSISDFITAPRRFYQVYLVE